VRSSECTDQYAQKGSWHCRHCQRRLFSSLMTMFSSKPEFWLAANGPCVGHLAYAMETRPRTKTTRSRAREAASTSSKTERASRQTLAWSRCSACGSGCFRGPTSKRENNQTEIPSPKMSVIAWLRQLLPETVLFIVGNAILWQSLRYGSNVRTDEGWSRWLCESPS